MHPASRLCLPLVVFLAVAVAAVPPVQERRGVSPPVQVRRVPWTTSRVVGSPEPPPPFRVARAFPKLKLANPIGVAREPGTDRLLLIHQDWAWGGRGRIVSITDDDMATKAEPFLTIDGIAYGIAFHPDYAKNGYLYVGGDGPLKGDKKKTRVIRYTVDRKKPHQIVAGSEKTIIEWESNGHNGGDVAFGPDGMLYVTSGDGTSDSDTNLTGQDLTKLLAKVLRIDVDRPDPGKAYSVPKDNPFVGRAGTRPETWAYGFRNPWRLHIDRATGDVWVGNNGQDLWEHIFLVRKGANYGWSVMEGSHPFYPDRQRGPEPFSKPIAEHHHSEARSMTGGVVYRGEKLPELRGAYIYGDWSTGKIWGIRHKAGKVTWHQELTDTTLQITGFGLDSKGELLIADHGGGYYRLERAPKETNPPKFPGKLSETGLYTQVKGHKVHPALIPYSVNSPLWSDGADKERFLALPGTAHLDYAESRGWNCPDDTVLVKTFSLGGQRIETRLLTRQHGEWAGYSYEWNDEQTDAVLVGKDGKDRAWKVGKGTQTWHYPSRTECMVCHSRAANWVLGLTTLQLNKVHDYGGVEAEQLSTLGHLGIFRFGHAAYADELKGRARRWRNELTGGLGVSLRAARAVFPAGPPLLKHLEADLGKLTSAGLDRLGREAYRPVDWLDKRVRDGGKTGPRMPKAPTEYGKLVDPYDRSQLLEARARSYLHANCAQCHVEAGGGNAAINLEFTIPRDKMNLVGVKPLHHTFDVPGAKLVAPGEPEKSLLYLRVAKRGPGQMPQLATSVVDREAVQLLHDWIKRMR